MSFAHPTVLIALIIPVLLVIYTWRKHTRALALPFDHKDTPSARWTSRLLNLANSLPAVILALVVVILAGPRRFERPKSERELTNIQFCLDVSGSMTAKFGNKDAYGVAMDSLNEFLTHRKGDAFSLIVFGDDNLRWVPLTTDPSSFSCAPPFLHPSNLPNWFRGGTAIGSALKQSERFLLQSDGGDRVIILISDGYSYDLSNGNDQKIAKSLQDNNITLYGIHIGQGEAPAEVTMIAQATGGSTFTAGDPQALTEVFAHIDQMQKAPFKRLTPDPVDHYTPYVIALFAVAGTYILTLFGLRYTPW
ncbi:Ca-activated chloride channel family protein [Rubritalea squalenifaciens DSM 18772]|uniref:Ca-activated chloride channel family protein n=2 Tax=Rubritalea TaxID=361050 RepID=A0A1M6NY58_9BACT|nr:VWA domain-containing protein [Rubritalea squalenifaciens]SHK00564.1 Ca-activated chloride channel family protein [Rubritalea squalenifaciens DSM 18772]